MWEAVHTVTGFCDGPRAGIADFGGAAHLYEAEWDSGRGDYGDTFMLMPVDRETLALALKDWAIWQRREAAFHRGLADRKTHPALPRDRERREELKSLLTGRLEVDPEWSVRMVGEFRVRTDAGEQSRGGLGTLEVRWREPA